MSEVKLRSLKFVHHWPSDYKIYPVNGAWGGVSGRGDVILHFFIERHKVPDHEIHEVRDDGTTGPMKREPEEQVDIDRDMQVGIMVNREQAVSIANWILQKVEEFEKASKGELKK